MTLAVWLKQPVGSNHNQAIMDGGKVVLCSCCPCPRPWTSAILAVVVSYDTAIDCTGATVMYSAGLLKKDTNGYVWGWDPGDHPYDGDVAARLSTYKVGTSWLVRLRIWYPLGRRGGLGVAYFLPVGLDGVYQVFDRANFCPMSGTYTTDCQLVSATAYFPPPAIDYSLKVTAATTPA